MVIYAEAFEVRGRHLISTERVLEQGAGRAQDAEVPNLVAQLEL